jgi:ABC-type glucose/galactose transport system permease subunit
MSERKLTIFIVVTHLVVFEARRVNGFFCDVNVFAVSLLEARRVDSGTTDTNFFTIGGLLEAWRVNSGTGNTGFLAIGWLELGRVYSCLIDTDLFTISGLELGSVLTFSEVKLGLVFVTTVVKVDGDISVVASAVWKIDVDVSFGVLVFGSD